MNDKVAVALAPGYLLHARPFRDSSVIADFFTLEHGRVSLVARGVRRPKSKLKGQLRPFQRMLISWVTRSSLGTLTALELEDKKNHPVPKRVLSKYYVNELIMRALRSGDSQNDLFLRYERFLRDIESNEEALVLRLFERDLLDFLGYGLQLSHTQSGEVIDSAKHYRFDPVEGPVEVASATGAINGSNLLALYEGRLNSSESMQVAKRILRQAIDFHLGAADSKVRQVMTSMTEHRRKWQQLSKEIKSGDTSS